MRMYDLIERKKAGKSLSKEEIYWMIEGYTKEEIPDYQMSAMTMAICFQGLNEKETLDLTLAMRDSGDCLDLSMIEGEKADKHSTGGVGDKTSLVLTPIIAALGIPIAKMAGRGLGYTGGTIDKLECFPGFTTGLSVDKFIRNVGEIQLAIAGQTADLAPADKKLYALRDVTATVDQMSLIASSIMSKKLAAGSDIIVLDVKTGSGAFMKELADARTLAETMVRIGTMAGKKTAAVITDMDQPLGNAVGNMLEVVEAIDTLSGSGPEDLLEVVYALGTSILLLAGKAKEETEAIEMIKDCISSGRAKQKMAEWVEAQDGDASYVWDTKKFSRAEYQVNVLASQSGFIQKIDAQAVGNTCMALGGGREKKDSIIDMSVGIVLQKKKGDFVSEGETLAVIHANDPKKGADAMQRIENAYTIGSENTQKEPIIKERIFA